MIRKTRKMLKASKRIIINSDRVNSFGFRVLSDGIDIEQYEKNPIMLWMHNRAWRGTKDEILPIGNVIELKREKDENGNNIITGLPVFDDTDPFAKSIHDKYENGTLRMASAGLDPISWSEEVELQLPGQTGYTLVKSKLREVSIADIGSNDDSLQIALYDDEGKIIKLSSNGDNPSIPQFSKINQKDMSKIQLSVPELTVKLGLKQDEASEQVILAAIDKMVSENQTLKTDKSTLEKSVSDKEAEIVRLKDDAETAKITSLVDQAVQDRKITADQKDHYVKLAKADFASVETILKSMPSVPSVEKKLAEGMDESEKTELERLVKLSYDELSAQDKLVKLKELDLASFKLKYKEKFNKEYGK